ncbi:S-layer homology domain-containing protein [Paenibacillus massiliensis]|uniref:S-layer homology domain-containing protein n=1 Tax=Paenibacillus massiliensis TaxID=225917 RepID=UPI0004B1346B|nr:S-layer homology domain-containing protein [Paenibacillus massiliensis]
MPKLKKSFRGLAAAIAASLFAAIIPQNAQAATEFKDIKIGSWYQGTVEWGMSKGIIDGYSDGTFKPNQEVSEAEFLAMMLRAFEPNITSLEGEHWAEAYYKRANELNYPVKDQTRNKAILRKQVAELISSTEGVNFGGDNAIHYLLAFGLAEGENPNDVTIQNFQGNKALTRAEAVQFVKNFTENGIGGLLERPSEPSDSSDLPPILALKLQK